jgi:proteasome lid subunit RPN8/RPN11
MHMPSSSSEWFITPSLVRNICNSARSTYPDEFISMLGVKEKGSHTLSELVIVPAEFGKTHSSVRTDLIPFDPLIVGSIHSHPNENARPSSADRNFFSRMGAIHLIAGYPYSFETLRAYSAQGKSINLRVFE